MHGRRGGAGGGGSSQSTRWGIMHFSNKQTLQRKREKKEDMIPLSCWEILVTEYLNQLSRGMDGSNEIREKMWYVNNVLKNRYMKKNSLWYLKVYNNTSEAMKGLKGVMFFPLFIYLFIYLFLLNSIDERKEEGI